MEARLMKFNPKITQPCMAIPFCLWAAMMQEGTISNLLESTIAWPVPADKGQGDISN